MNIIEISNQNLQKAQQIIDELQIEPIWKNLDAQINLVGSVRTNLLMDHLDIDFHVYTKKLSIETSFLAIAKIAENKRIKELQYTNLLDEEDQCIEWHLHYLDSEDRIWQIDIIHILEESKYAGVFERIADKINQVISKEKREIILQLKHQLYQKDYGIKGIEVYKAVLRDGVSNYGEFMDWLDKNSLQGIDEWEPF